MGESREVRMLALGGAGLWGEWSEFPGWVAKVPGKGGAGCGRGRRRLTRKGAARA